MALSRSDERSVEQQKRALGKEPAMRTINEMTWAQRCAADADTRSWAMEYRRNEFYYSHKWGQLTAVADGTTTVTDVADALAAGTATPYHQALAAHYFTEAADYLALVALGEVDRAQQGHPHEGLADDLGRVPRLVDDDELAAAEQRKSAADAALVEAQQVLDAAVDREDEARREAEADSEEEYHAAGAKAALESEVAGWWRAAVDVAYDQLCVEYGNDGHPENDRHVSAEDKAAQAAAVAQIAQVTGLPTGAVWDVVRDTAERYGRSDGTDGADLSQPDWDQVAAYGRVPRREVVGDGQAEDSYIDGVHGRAQALVASGYTAAKLDALDSEARATETRARDTGGGHTDEANRAAAELDAAWYTGAKITYREHIIGYGNDGRPEDDRQLPADDSAQRDASVDLIAGRTGLESGFIREQMWEAAFAEGRSHGGDGEPDYFAADWEYLTAEAARRTEILMGWSGDAATGMTTAQLRGEWPSEADAVADCEHRTAPAAQDEAGAELAGAHAGDRLAVEQEADRAEAEELAFWADIAEALNGDSTEDATLTTKTEAWLQAEATKTQAWLVENAPVAEHDGDAEHPQEWSVSDPDESGPVPNEFTAEPDAYRSGPHGGDTPAEAERATETDINILHADQLLRHREDARAADTGMTRPAHETTATDADTREVDTQ